MPAPCSYIGIGRAVLAALMLQLMALQLACPSNLAAIQASRLDAENKAVLAVFEVERAWVDAKTTLAGTLEGLAAAGIELPVDVRARLLQLRNVGNASLSAAKIALAQGETEVDAGTLGAALRSLEQVTRTLQTEVGGLR